MIRLVKLTATAVWFPALIYALVAAAARPVRVVVIEPEPEPDDEPEWREATVSTIHPLELMAASGYTTSAYLN